jgi:hypothetical protein
MGENPNTNNMSIYVTWGNNHPSYNKSNKEYNSPISIWDRYSENIKRGYILKNQPNVWIQTFKNDVCTNLDTKPETPLNPLDFSNGLMNLQIMKEKGFEILYNLKKNNTSIEIMNMRLNSFMEEIKNGYGEEYHNWGLNGDDYSFENNPFTNSKSLNNSKK